MVSPSRARWLLLLSRLAIPPRLQIEPVGAMAFRRMMNSWRVLHGMVMLDLMALTLPRVTGLASGTGS